MVKDLMIPSIDNLSSDLQNIDCGTSFITGKVEVFSCNFLIDPRQNRWQ